MNLHTTPTRIEAPESVARVLIVDDEPKTLYTMEMLLSPEPYDISFAGSGQAALANIAANPPDVLLLDVMMPDITGYEVCQQLKADPDTRHIPIILVTALDSKEDVVRGLDAGADEFLTKPVNGPELRARVRSMLRIKQQYDELQETMQLREDMADMIVHDMRTPVSALLLFTDLLQKNPQKVSHEQLVSRIRLQAFRLNAFLGDLLLLAKMRSGKLILQREPVNTSELVRWVARQFKETAAARAITLHTALPPLPLTASLDRKLMQRVLDNLLSNALKFSPEGSTVTVRLDPVAVGNGHDGFRLQVIDQGPGIPEAHRAQIFDKYEILDTQQIDIPQVGLGLALCRLVVDAHGGRISVTDNVPSGAIFTLEI